MKRPDFQEKTEVKVITHDKHEYIRENGIERQLDMYGWRGKVVKITGIKDHIELKGTGKRYEEVARPYTPENYPDIWWVDVKFKSPIDGSEYVTTFEKWEKQLIPVQKKFIDIDYIREKDIQIGVKEDGTPAIRPSNIGAFEPGDIISITTKIDGANASIAWDETTGKLEIFSRTNLLDGCDGLRGFVSYIRTNVEPKLLKCPIDDIKNLVVFGEWCVSHTVKYNNDWYNKWRVYDIWDKASGKYMPQGWVKLFCVKYGLEYVEELYYGPFISWDHCRSFIGKSIAYGPVQEGIVIKNQTKLGNLDNRNPVYIKIVDEKFKEHMENKGHKQKEIDPAKEAEKQKATELIATVVTEARVKKNILKLVDEGILQENLTPKDIGKCMKELPKRIFDDILKEEPDIVKQAGEYAGKCCSAQTAALVRKIIIG